MSRFEKIVIVPPPQHEIVRDSVTGLEWQAVAFDKKMTWKEAEKACRDLRLGGHSDWRLPTRVELLTLVDDTRFNPAIDTDAFPNTPSDWFWTSTPYAPNPTDYAWVVDFGGGGSLNVNRGSYNRVRASVIGLFDHDRH
jgi:hypothetical protein